jgi:hypothetical protein
MEMAMKPIENLRDIPKLARLVLVKSGDRWDIYAWPKTDGHQTWRDALMKLIAKHGADNVVGLEAATLHFSIE